MQELRTQVRWSHVAMTAALAMTALMVGLVDTSPAETSALNTQLAENEPILSYTVQPSLSGSIVIAGSDNMQPLMVAWVWKMNGEHSRSTSMEGTNALPREPSLYRRPYWVGPLSHTSKKPPGQQPRYWTSAESH